MNSLFRRFIALSSASASASASAAMMLTMMMLLLVMMNDHDVGVFAYGASSSSSEYIQHKGYAGIVGNDLSCGTFGSQEAIEDYCNLNLDCMGYSHHTSHWSTSQGGPWWCAKTTSAKGNYDQEGVWYEKPPPPWWDTSGGEVDCHWTISQNRYSNGYAGGVSQVFTLAGAQAKCLELGPSVCPAVTCGIDANFYTDGCTVRATAQLGTSPTGESSYVPSADCATVKSVPTSVIKVSEGFENLGSGYCRDVTGNYNTNWAVKSYCVDLLTCERGCKDQDNCVGIAWASNPSWDHDGCTSYNLPRCVVYHSKVVSMNSVTPGTMNYVYAPLVVATQASVSPGEYTAYRYIAASPTNAPTDVPTNAPTKEPTEAPTNVPTNGPTNAPTNAPTDVPTTAPTTAPTKAPTAGPTYVPTNAPTIAPTNAPTATPTVAPTTVSPTQNPTMNPTDVPTTNPSESPSGSFFPSSAPTISPTKSPAPSASPTAVPSASPTKEPTEVPTNAPTTGPTNAPTPGPTAGPTNAPTTAPTNVPTDGPTHAPTNAPTTTPTDAPTDMPTHFPTNAPTNAPTDVPTGKPTNAPTDAPTGAAKARTFPLPLGFEEECPNDILLLKQEGVANYPEDAIRTSIHILRQEETTVTVELLQLFSHHIDYIFYQYNVNVFNDKCYEKKNVVGGESIVELTIECTRTSQVAFLDLWIADDGSQGVAYAQQGDTNAIIPDCCYPDDVPKGTPVTYYSFEIKCVSECEG